MKFKNPTAEIFVPDGMSTEAALRRTTIMGICAHQDDLEIIASSAILEAFQNGKEWFCGVVLTDGRRSARSGPYEKVSDDEMQKLRKKEQKKAAVIGEYGSLALLDYPSDEVKKNRNQALSGELIQILERANPKVVYTHNLADKHETHVATVLKTIEAIRLLPVKKRPKRLLGCEVWRSLDWLCDRDKVVLDSSAHENLKAALLGVYDSQITGGKRYDLATIGRQRANATYHDPTGIDRSTALTFAIDLTPLIEDAKKEPSEFVKEKIDRFREEALLLLKSLS
ncbi:MAG: PIG-L family deacetylase [Pseudomonadota bacterium]